MANGYDNDYTIKLGIKWDDVDKAIKDIDTTFNKKYKLNVDISDIDNLSKSLSNMSKAIDKINSSSGNTPKQTKSRIQSLVDGLYSPRNRAKNEAKLSSYEKQIDAKTKEYEKKVAEFEKISTKMQESADSFGVRYKKSKNVDKHSKAYLNELKKQYQYALKLSEIEKELNSDKFSMSNSKGILGATTNKTLQNAKNIIEVEDNVKNIITSLHKSSTVSFGDVSKDLQSISYIVTDVDGNAQSFVGTLDNINGGIRELSVASKKMSGIKSLADSLYSTSTSAKNKSKLSLFEDPEVVSKKTNEYKTKLDEYRVILGKLENLSTDFAKNNDGKNITSDSDEYVKALTERYYLTEKLTSLQKELNSDKYDVSNKYGTLERTDDYLKGINNISEAEDKIKNLIAAMHDTSDGAISFGDISKDLQSISYAVTDADGNVQNFKGTLDNVNGGIRELAVAGQKISGIKSLADSLYSTNTNAKNRAKLNLFDDQEVVSKKTDKYKIKLNEYKVILEQLEGLSSNFIKENEGKNLTSDSDEYIKALTERCVLTEKLTSLHKELNSDRYNLSNKNGVFYKTDDTLKGIKNITDAEDKVKHFITTMRGVNGNTVSFGDVSKDLQSISYSVTNADGKVENFKGTLDNINGGIRELAVTSSDAGTQVTNAFSDLKASAAQYLASILTMRTAINVLKNGMSVVKEFNRAMTSISMTMDTTPAQLEGLGDAVIDAAKNMGTSVSQALDAAKIYANMQTTPEEIVSLTTPTIELANAAEINTSEASGYIQSVINQFEMATEDAEHIADVYENISANIKLDFAEGIKDIAEGVEVAGTIVNESGMSFEKFAAIVAKTAETTRQGGSQIGNQWKTILTRISKASGVSDEEIDPETLSKASESLHKIGIEVYNAQGEFNNIDNILTELSEKWDSLSDAQQAEISFNLAATRNRNTLTVALKNYAEATELAIAAENDSGTAAKNQELLMDSYVAKLNQAGVEIDKLYHTFLDNDLTKGVIDAFTGLLNIINEAIDAFGDFGVVIATVLGAKGIGKLGEMFKLQHIQAFSKALSGIS